MAKALSALRDLIMNHKKAVALREGADKAGAKAIVERSHIQVFPSRPNNALHAEYTVTFVVPNATIDGEAVAFNDPLLKQAFDNSFAIYFPDIIRTAAVDYESKALTALNLFDAKAAMDETMIYLRAVQK